MDNQSYNIRVPKRWVRIALIVAATALVVAPLTAVATHMGFTDVPDTNTHHNDIAWLKDADVTKGCNPPANDNYCPNDFVTRAQMATFMRNLASNQVVDAGTLEGKTASDLENSVFFTSGPFTVSLTGGATTEVKTLDLPAGTYLLSASGQLNNNAATQQRGGCSLTAGGETVARDNFIQLGPNAQIGSREDWTLFLVAELVSPGAASISCTTSAGFSGNIIRPQIVAQAVDSLTVQSLDLASVGDADS